MRVNRLLEITTLLMSRKSIPAKEFAERFQVSTRTIYRDVEELSAASVPVYMSKGKGGGISLLDTFTVNKTLVSGQESDSLLLALQTLQATQFPEVKHLLARLEVLFQRPATEDWVHIEFSPWGSNPNEENKFIEIKHAILRKETIRFDYVDARGEKSLRRVEPMRLIFKSHAWYLWGYCRDRKDFRTFRLSRMKCLALTGEVFVRRLPGFPEEGVAHPLEKPLTHFRLRFGPEALPRVYDDFDESLIVRTPDGFCEVSVDFVEDEWVYGFFLAYGCSLEILEPDRFRREFANRLRMTLRRYEG